jgi:anti-anti-sigma factor
MSVMSPHWCFETQDSGPATVLRFAGRQVRLGEQHLRLADEYLSCQDVEGREVTLDLSNVECLASTALAGLVRLHEKLTGAHGHLRLQGVRPHLYELLETTQLHHLLDVRKTEGLPQPDPELAEERH